MSRGYGGNWTLIDPFSGLDESVVTSNVISTRFAFDLTLSRWTNSGTTSQLTYWISNASGNVHHSVHGSGVTPSTLAIPEVAWSQWTGFGHADASSEASTLDPPLGYRWARITRLGSGATFEIALNRLER
jgi:hypothetical protein